MYGMIGQATVELSPFKKIVGVDPSEKMISSARELNKASHSKIEFVQAPAENLSFLKDSSVDLIASGIFATMWQLDRSR